MVAFNHDGIHQPLYYRDSYSFQAMPPPASTMGDPVVLREHLPDRYGDDDDMDRYQCNSFSGHGAPRPGPRIIPRDLPVPADV